MQCWKARLAPGSESLAVELSFAVHAVVEVRFNALVPFVGVVLCLLKVVKLQPCTLQVDHQPKDLYGRNNTLLFCLNQCPTYQRYSHASLLPDRGVLRA